jgi:hypothetical protein
VYEYDVRYVKEEKKREMERGKYGRVEREMGG